MSTGPLRRFFKLCTYLYIDIYRKIKRKPRELTDYFKRHIKIDLYLIEFVYHTVYTQLSTAPKGFHGSLWKWSCASLK